MATMSRPPDGPQRNRLVGYGRCGNPKHVRDGPLKAGALLRICARTALPAALCLLMLLAAVCACKAQPTVALREQAEVGEGDITLADLADITAADDLADTLAQVQIGPSPLPGRSRSISAGYIRMRIGRAGLDPQAVQIIGAPSVTVHRQGPPSVLERPRSATRATAATAPPPLGGTDAQHAAAHAISAAAAPLAAPAPLLRRGERVQVVVVSGAIVIQTSGRLMGDAIARQQVMVQVSGTGQRLSGLLTGPRQVEIRL